LVENVSAADNVPRLATTSTVEEWAETARTLFDNRRYLQAARSYERADRLREKDVAFAYYLREQARKIPHSRNTVDNPRKVAFVTAADAFMNSANAATLRSEKLTYYRLAAECYSDAEDLRKAAKAYIQAERHTRAAQTYRKGGFFNEAVDTIGQYKAHVDPEEADKILSVAKVHYFKQQDLE
jgi:tetratricopeptide (TPR) repeat protein